MAIPMTWLWVGFAISLVCLILAAAKPSRATRRVAMGVFGASTLLLAAAFCIRWATSGRVWYLPPMINQWEAIIASALGAAVVASVGELLWKKNYIALAASFYATVALLCVHFGPILFPGQMNPQLTEVPAILSSKLLALHVSVIVVGHALVGTTFFISLIYLVLAAKKNSAVAVVDRCNLITAQLACWTVITGTVLGAYWGDIAWGRWWGWDRKETWTLITIIVYIVALHLRFVVSDRRRGLVMAWICVAGFAVMLFNWIVVNYFLTGLHSYAV